LERDGQKKEEKTLTPRAEEREKILCGTVGIPMIDLEYATLAFIL
jgi:hypothetical protein